MPEQTTRRGNSPYSTGGGGVVLEHQYAAAALAGVLLAESVPGLGDDFTARRVGLQQGQYSPVDDVLIEGESEGRKRLLRVACRRRPTIGRSDRSTVKLFADFLSTLLSQRADLQEGHLRLGLAVSGPYGPASELEILADLARRRPDRVSFTEAVLAPGAYSQKVRTRLTNVDEVVTEALDLVGEEGSSENAEDLTWELLRSLYVIQIQFEGDVAPGRTEVVARLQRLTGDAATASRLWLKLTEIAAQGAQRAALLDRGMLRRRLLGFSGLAGSKDFALAREQVDVLEAELRRRVQGGLRVPASDSLFALERAEVQAQLKDAISSSSPEKAIVVHGEPGVGKSALALQVADSIRAADGTVLAVSLRDLPQTPTEFKAKIGLSPQNLIGAAPSSELSVLLLDGAEMLQEVGTGAAGLLLEACRSTGRTPVLVTRNDALGVVRNLALASGESEPIKLEVPALSDDEIAEVVAAVPGLESLADDDRSRWLLRRLGLIDLLLHSVEKGAELPSSLSSEADVFRVVWSGLVRQNERRTKAVSPDDREAAVLGVAERLLGRKVPVSTGPALATLRSDGVLLPLGPTAAWRPGDEFASDVIRDFAVARLFLRDGLNPLAESDAPRWAVRASRIFVQGRIANALAAGTDALTKQWEDLRRQFQSLASRHGARWTEIPWEGLLSASWAGSVLEALYPDPTERSESLDEAIRCVRLRFSEAGACDPFIAAPLIEGLVDGGLIEEPRRYGDDPKIDFVASWLRGAARHEASGGDLSPLRPLRGRVRDALLKRPIERGEAERLECLGLLGTEATRESREVLTAMASTAPAFLSPVVESLDVAMSLAVSDVPLLAELTEAYYVERPSKNSPGSFLLGDGIRRHRGGGIGTPMAAWYRGPFLFLLRRDPRSGLAVIHKMLDRAARTRVTRLAELSNRRGSVDPPRVEETGVTLELLGQESRVFIGDDHVWRWYRGSSVGPYPCMSALMCLELVLDELLQGGASVRTIAEASLRNATTLAIPGLVYGFLVRHIGNVTNELDGFLSNPDIWYLEFSRTVSEGRLHVQGSDHPDLVGKERRSWTPGQVSSHLVLEASRRKDEHALERLRGVGRLLVERAGGDDARPEVLQWAAHLDVDSYELEKRGDLLVGRVHPPRETAEALSVAQERSERVLQLYGLQHRYRLRLATPYRYVVPTPSRDPDLKQDVTLARDLKSKLPEQPLDQVRMALSGVAAAVVTHGDLERLPPDSVCWAVSVLLDSALQPYVEGPPIESSIFPDGADRKAAIALPQSMPVVEGCEDVHAAEFLAALKAGAASVVVEVRGMAAEGCLQVFGHDCRSVFDGRCWHQVAWDAVEHGARHVCLGSSSTHGQRQIKPIDGHLLEGLEQAETHDLMLTHIAPAAAAAIGAARGSSCVREEAGPLRDGLIKAYVRAACHWAEENYDIRDEQRGLFASALLDWAGEEDVGILMDVARRFSQAPTALGDFLHSLTLVATYEPQATYVLAETWPNLMRLGLDILREHDQGDRHGRENLVRNLVPDPTPSSHVGSIDQVLENARANWLMVDSVSADMDEWLTEAIGARWCVDALVSFLQAQPQSDQVDPGVRWVRKLIVDDDTGEAETSGFLLISWLSELRSAPSLQGKALADFRAIVDALALSGFSGAKDLQKRDE